MLWFIFAVLHSVFQAGFNELNRIYKIDSWQLNFLHGLFSFLLLSPAIIFIWPLVTWHLVGAAFIIASFITVGSQAQIFMSAQHNGRVSSMWRPVSIFVAFIFWIGLFPETAKSYMEDPKSLTLILVSFALIIFSIVLIRRNDIGWRAFLLIGPIGVLYGLTAVISKYALDGEQTFMQALSFTLIVYFFMLLFSLGAMIAKGKVDRDLLSPVNVKAGILISIASVVSYIFIVLSFVEAPNPAFANVIGSLSPVWIMVYHRFVGIKDNASPIAGLVMIFAAVILLFATA